MLFGGFEHYQLMFALIFTEWITTSSKTTILLEYNTHLIYLLIVAVNYAQLK